MVGKTKSVFQLTKFYLHAPSWHPLGCLRSHRDRSDITLDKYPNKNNEMIKSLRILCLLAVLLVGPAASLHAQNSTAEELDAYWAEVTRTVQEGDFEGYKALYHDDAVLVSTFSGDSRPIASAFEGWEQGFTDSRNGVVDADVEFRFSQRLNDETTAHETGMFDYSVQQSGGERTHQYIHFAALLVNKGGWLMLMEYQKSPGTRDEWEALN